ncbi:MAG: hypothetical protein PWQ51_757 [Methanolobus sp.]|jgi:signal transduction histidine kinase|nr:hypothetical protein [Methanolobus sp.]
MLDIKSLYISLFITQVILTLIYFFYWKTQKTYPGFYEWTLSLFVASIAKILFIFRDTLPDFLTITIANTLSVLYFVLVLDALKLYFTNHRLRREIYFLSFPLIISLYYFTEYVDSAEIRNSIYSISSIILIILILKVLLTKSNSTGKLFSRLLAAGYVLYMFTLVVRLGDWFSNFASRNLFSPSTFNVLLMLIGIITILDVSLSFILLNFQRSTQELDKAKIESQNIANRYSLAASSAKAGLWYMDLNTDTYHWDDSLERLLRPEIDILKKLQEIWNSFEITNEYMPDTDKRCTQITDERHLTTEFSFHRKNKGLLHFMVHAHIVCNAEGSNVVVGLIYDITSLRKAENALKESNKKLNLMNSITRHDILNMTNGTNGFAELLIRELDDPELNKMAEHIAYCADMTSKLISFTAQYQDLGTTEPLWQNISLLLEDDEFKFITEGKSLNYPEPDILIYTDKMLKKVLYNLIENSLRHGQNVNSFSFFYDFSEDGLNVVYTDDGIGIPDENKDKIFERNFGTNTGLGLFFCREVLEISGLKIRENGVYGQGARFEINVPSGSFRKVDPDLD